MTSPSRLSRLRQRMRSAGLDALLVSSPSDVRYLTGFTGSNALAIVRRRSLTLVTDTRYELQSSMEARGIRRIISRDSLAQGVAMAQGLDGLRIVGFEAQHVTYAQYRQLRSSMSPRRSRTGTGVTGRRGIPSRPLSSRASAERSPTGGRLPAASGGETW